MVYCRYIYTQIIPEIAKKIKQLTTPDQIATYSSFFRLAVVSRMGTAAVEQQEQWIQITV
jgi:hypothetical protein